MHALRQQVASAIQLLIHLERLTGGRRKIVRIEEITGMEGDKICLQDLFTFEQTGIDADGHAQGSFSVSGHPAATAEPPDSRGGRAGRGLLPPPRTSKNRGWENLDMLAQYTIVDYFVAAALFVLVLSIWLGAVVLWSIRRNVTLRQVRQRIGLGDRPAGVRRLTLWHDGEEVTTTVPDQPARASLLQRWERICQDAGWDSRPFSILAGAAGAMLLAAVAAWAITGNTLLAVVSGAGVASVFWIYVKQKVTQVEAFFERQFVDGLELAARSLRAGHPLIAAFRVIADEIPAPVGALFSRICQQQAVGVGLEQSLRQCADATNSPDMKLFAISVGVQLRSGGSLAEMMDRLSQVMRSRMKLTRRLRVLTAQTQAEQAAAAGPAGAPGGGPDPDQPGLHASALRHVDREVADGRRGGQPGAGHLADEPYGRAQILTTLYMIGGAPCWIGQFQYWLF